MTNRANVLLGIGMFWAVRAVCTCPGSAFAARPEATTQGRRFVARRSVELVAVLKFTQLRASVLT